MPRRHSGSAAVLAYLAKGRHLRLRALARKRSQDPCPGSVSVDFAAQHEPCPAPAAEALEPSLTGLSGPRILPDGCDAEPTRWVRP